MKTLTIRQVPDEVHDALRLKAAANGRSMEEEVRALIAAHATPKLKPDFTALRELQRRVAANLPPGLPSAAEIVREFRNEDVAAVDAKWARIEEDARRAAVAKKDRAE